mgnify:CR=1 FL=1
MNLFDAIYTRRTIKDFTAQPVPDDLLHKALDAGRYDAVAEHASAEEMHTLFRTRRSAFYLLGVILALLAYVPILGFFAPVLFGLAFIHFGLADLREMRAAPIAGEVVPPTLPT